MIERIPKEQWSELDWSDFGGTPPTEGEIFGYVQDGKVLGYYLVERERVHVGPFFVEHSHRGNGVATALAQHAHDTLGSGYYVAALSLQTAGMCAKFGMTKIDGTLYVK